jgi:hypothetical protein
MRFGAALAALTLGGGALANDETAALAEFRAAVAIAEKHADDRYAFTLDFRDLSDKGERVFRVRFDPRKLSGARWSAVDPPADQYGKEEKAAFDRMTRNDEADDSLVYEGLAETLGETRLLSADANRAIFSIPLSDPETPASVKEALAATATLDRKGGFISSVEIRSTKPFKPAAVAKIKSMRQLQRYGAPAAGGPALLVATEADAEGSAMFRDFSSKARLTYSDIEKVDAPPRAPKEGALKTSRP